MAGGLITRDGPGGPSWFGAASDAYPKDVSSGTNGLFVVGQDTGGGVWINQFDPGAGNGWHPWIYTGRVLNFGLPTPGVPVPVVATTCDSYYIFGTDSSGQSWWYQSNGQGWTAAPATGSISSQPILVPRTAVQGCTGGSVGFVDSVSCSAVSGWAADRTRLNAPISVDLILDGVPVGRAIANSLRPDVGAFLGDSGAHGYSLMYPASFIDSRQHWVGIRYQGPNLGLGGRRDGTNHRKGDGRC